MMKNSSSSSSLTRVKYKLCNLRLNRLHFPLLLAPLLFFLLLLTSFPVKAVYLVGVEGNPPNPFPDSGNEWVIIYNPSSSPVNLTNWYVDVDGKTETISKKTIICPQGYYLFKPERVTAWITNTGLFNVTLYDNLGNIVSRAKNLSDGQNDEYICYNATGSPNGWVCPPSSTVTLLGKEIDFQGKVWSTNYTTFYTATLNMTVFTCTLRNESGDLKNVRDMIADARIHVPATGEWINHTLYRSPLNSTQIHYTVQFIGGEDVGFIPPYMLVDLSSPRDQTVLNDYYIHTPVEGLKLKGWNVGDYWLLSGVAAKERKGKLFKSMEIYILFFRTPGASFGSPPSGNDYLNLTKKMIYYRTKIIEDIWRSMEVNGIWDSFWNNVGSYLNSYVKIWSAVRKIIKAYIP